ncbi:hypothetical protein AB0L34_19000 [Micromonospora sp. NPDC052213]
MDNRTEVREFLVSRRAKISPEQVGLPAGTKRRSRDYAAAKSRRSPA